MADGKILPLDTDIPGLKALRTGRLDGLLAEAGLPPGPFEATVLKHHPGSRCTVLVEREGRRVVVKAYAEDPQDQVTLYEHLAAAGLASGRAPTAVPLLARDPGARVIAMAYFHQQPCRDLVAEGRPARAGELGAAWLRAVTEAGAAAGAAYGPRELLADADGWATRLGRAEPDLEARARNVVGLLRTGPPGGGIEGLRHGSYSASHVFDLGGGPGVIDWDGYRRGPVEFDAGRFLAGLSSMAAGRRRLADEARTASHSFRASLRDLVEEDRLRWYRAGHLLRLAYYASVRQPRRWPERSETMLAEATGLLR